MQQKMNRYSDQDLLEFKSLLEQKKALAQEQLDVLTAQYEEYIENEERGYDPDDNSTSFANREFLQELMYRQQKHIRSLGNALIRIQNKTFGVCEITGELIDKRRMKAVPTTTKSLLAKLSAQEPSQGIFPIKGNKSDKPVAPKANASMDTEDTEEEWLGYKIEEEDWNI